MIINSQGSILNIVLDSECTIAEVKNDFYKIKEMPQLPGNIEIAVDKLEDIDTAYFQMLLSLKAWAGQKEIPFKISGKSAGLDEISRLYGVEL